MKQKKEYFHAIKLVEENCTGCTKCVRVCPTEALRVRNGKVQLDSTRCVDCGKCVQACPFDAIQTYADDLNIIDKFKYKVAVISTSFAGQFSESIGYANAKKALLHMGFDEVAEESMVTELMSSIIRDYIRKNSQIRPIISSNCPAIVRLIQVRFNSLLPNILRIEAPMSVLALYYRNKIARQKNISEEDIGVFLIVPCISQVTAVHQPEGAYKNVHDGAISISEVYKEVISNIKEVQKDETPIETYPKGLSWAISGMEAEEVNDGTLRTLAVSGIHNVIKILHKIEDQQLETYDFVVLHSCTNGCVGGVLNVENPFVATSRIRNYLRTAEHKNFADDYFYEMYQNNMFDVLPLESRSIMSLDSNIKDALEKMKKIREITKILPGLDCSACGSPTCRALAEDIVVGKAELDDCMVRLKKMRKQKK
ncbi:MAG: hypothetical protein PWQ09_232 [Candidatus Cloacimonadota bacterium]|jgi:Na+-translocating ferredoxin:NAD+ oxidoreductase RNF subunit RnfB|nr:hypothetical protein [Candidatus Cloacimonadota bacterium]